MRAQWQQRWRVGRGVLLLLLPQLPLPLLLALSQPTLQCLQ